MKYISVFLASFMLFSCQLINKNIKQELNEEEFFDEEVDIITQNEEYIEDSFETIDDPQEALAVNEEIKKEEELIEVQDKIFFDFNSSSLSEEAKKIANLQHQWLEENPDIKITIEGHCDERGTREYNMSLGAKRAEALNNYFVAKGINKNRISVISFGEEKPYLSGAGEEIWQQNRRVVIIEK